MKAKMKCEKCRHFHYCESNNLILDVTTSDDMGGGWTGSLNRVYVLGVDAEQPEFCPYRKENMLK